MSIREVAAGAYRGALPVLVASAFGGLVAGVVLGGMRGEFRAVPGLLVLVPALLATRGNVYGALGARLSTGLHQGIIEPRVDLGDERARRAVAAALVTGFLASVFAAVLTYGVLVVLQRPVAGLAVLVSIAAIAGLLSGLSLVIAVVVVVFVGYRRGLDPDTLAGPIVTTTGDVFGVAFLLLAVRIVIGVG